MKAVLISIQPKWCELIVKKKKTVEVRKSRPSLDEPFKCYIYCTNSKIEFLQSRSNVLFYCENKDFIGGHGPGSYTRLNSHVIGEFVCDSIEHYTSNCTVFESVLLPSPSELEEMCLTLTEFNSYGTRGKILYGWHISDLVIYDRPKELSEFYTVCKMNCEYCEMWGYTRVNADEFDMDCKSDWPLHKTLKRPPQSWCYVEVQDG